MPHSTVEPRMNTSAELRPLDVDEALDALPALYWPLLALTLGCHVTLTQGVKVWLLRRRWIYHVDDPAARIPDNKRLEMGPGNTLPVQIAGKLPPPLWSVGVAEAHQTALEHHQDPARRRESPGCLPAQPAQAFSQVKKPQAGVDTTSSRARLWPDAQSPALVRISAGPRKVDWRRLEGRCGRRHAH